MTTAVAHDLDALPRQRIRFDGATKHVLMLPDYQVSFAPSSPYHRRGAIDGETACGLPIPGMHAYRGYLLDDRLCADCFTRHELELGRRAVEVCYPIDEEPT